MSENPLGQTSEHAHEYSPDLLFAVPRADSRREFGVGADLPFRGVDIWNAWELTWLDASGRPLVATAEIHVEATSPNIIESKSLKLYLNSLAMTNYDHADAVAAVIAADLSATAGDAVDVHLHLESTWDTQKAGLFPGTCIDREKVSYAATGVDTSKLATGQRRG